MSDKLQAATAEAQEQGLTPDQLAVIIQLITMVISWFQNRK